jgi:cell division protein FtsB
LGAKFGEHLGEKFGEIIVLEKTIKTQQIQIQAMNQNETRLNEHIQGLEDELTLLKSENFELQQMAKRQNASEGRPIIQEGE